MNLRLLDGNEVVALMLHHYDDLYPEYQGPNPLKLVFILEAIDDSRGEP